MKIAVDCRYLGMSGIGRFLQGILENLDFNKNEYVLIGKKSELDKIDGRFVALYNELNPFSIKSVFIKEQRVINSCDVFFTPNFIIPFGIKCRIFSVIHDIVFLKYRELNKSFIDFRIKKALLKRAIKKSQNIFTVTEFSKKEINSFFPKSEKKITVLGNALSKTFLDFNREVEKQNRIIFLGNIKKHKGLTVLLEAFRLLKDERSPLELYLVGDKDNFRTSDGAVSKIIETNGVNFINRLEGEVLAEFIAGSKFLILPSYYEGFGIPPLEALALKTKPIISNIEVFKEVYNGFDVIFFETGDANSLKEAILTGDTNVSTTIEDILKRFSYANYADTIVKLF